VGLVITFYWLTTPWVVQLHISRGGTGKLLLALASKVILGSEPRTHENILLFHYLGVLSIPCFYRKLIGRVDCRWPSPVQSFLASGLVDINEQYFSLLHMYWFRNCASSTRGGGLICLCRSYVWYNGAPTHVRFTGCYMSPPIRQDSRGCYGDKYWLIFCWCGSNSNSNFISSIDK
jgi:hypothetical protein